MPDAPFKPHALKDGMSTFEKGVNHGIAAELIPDNQLWEGINTNLRGYLVRPRSYFIKRNLNYLNANKAVLDAAWQQGGCIYTPDATVSNKACIMLSASGRLYQLEIDGNQANVSDVTRGMTQNATATQCWLWQGEKWIFWNDGSSLPVFYDGPTTTRSNYGVPQNFTNWNALATDFVVPAIGDTTTFPGGIEVGSTSDMVVGDILTVRYRGLAQVQQIVDGTHIQVLNISMTPVGQHIALHSTSDRNLSWTHIGTQLPPGRQGTYGKGRIWMTLVDGKQYVAGDQVGGSSGTKAEQYRDAIKEITENLYLAGGGNFAVPGTVGEITAMKFATELDKSLGQGPLQIFTRTTVFSCNASTIRSEWQDVTNPIQTESCIGTGATGQNSTVTVNGDIIMRSIAGLNSLILARREFDTWGNTPLSHEVNPTFTLDDQSILPWASGINFDNRLLMTTRGIVGPHGVYWKCMVPIDFDPVSGIAGKGPSLYDARIWEGLNIYQLFTGEFQGVQRAFAICFNIDTDELELFEILVDKPGQVADNGGLDRVTWEFQSGMKNFKDDPKNLAYKRLVNGSVAVEDLIGEVNFSVYWKPDDWPCWVPWHEWTECSSPPTNSNKPNYRPRMGLGEPKPDVFNELGLPLREGYQFQFKIVITGHCTFKGMKLNAVTAPEPQFPPLALDSPLCQ